ncbi:hypothetical protein [Erythrobacter sp. THAF29]|uniref:hypothetical protein n=1 Tax=Erythrobacter sp. THAF29 TaxID=2587851 RepID=UPI0012693435|nr:hypothetical protein [Erythrobacter sp. THAF29]QFT76773.1 hypothetical protein FIU90_04365 [Erythrobacter sp. THAF29]
MTALLIRRGYLVYRPEADVGGEDLVLRLPDERLAAVQLKSRMTVDWNRYGGKGMWMLFPDQPWNSLTRRCWFLVPHDELFEFLNENHGHTKSFADKRWSAIRPSKAALLFLEDFKLDD